MVVVASFLDEPFSRKMTKIPSRRDFWHRRLWFEPLEDRRLSATYFQDLDGGAANANFNLSNDNGAAASVVDASEISTGCGATCWRQGTCGIFISRGALAPGSYTLRQEPGANAPRLMHNPGSAAAVRPARL